MVGLCKMKYWPFLVACVVCLGLMTAPQVSAAEKGSQGEHHEKWHGEGHSCNKWAHARMAGMHHRMHHRIWHVLMKLDLNAAQRTAINEIRITTEKTMIQQKADLKIARLELRELLHKEPVDMSAVEAQVKKAEGIRTSMILGAIKAREDVKAKLTPEQKKKLKELLFGQERHKSREMKEKKRPS